MQIITEPNKEKWNAFVAAHSSPSSFLQSWEWGEFQKAIGHKIYRLAAVGETGEYKIAAQAIVRDLNFGKTYLEITKGPIGEGFGPLIEEFNKIAARENAVLVRINPPYGNVTEITNANFIKPQILLRQTEPEDTVLVDLSKSEEDLLSKMHEKSRYNIRLAIKKGVKVFEKTGDGAAFEKFLELIEETAKRDGITVWPRTRFEKFREFFLRPNDTNDPRAILLTGEYDGKVLAAAIVMLFGDSGTYLYAASSAQDRNANVPSLVLWEAIRQSKLAGKKYYDMWGIAPQGAPEDHPWSGITRFKSRYITVGVTGVEKHYVGTRDLIRDNKYYKIFKLARILRRIIKK